jgi:hypothetical protein
MKHLIKTPKGDGFLENIWISELGFVMVKVFYPNDKIFITYNINKLEKFLEETKLSFKK